MLSIFGNCCTFRELFYEVILKLNFQDKNVESLVRDVNSHMRQRQEHERLKNIIARIDSYEPIVGFRSSEQSSDYILLDSF